jgi:hypothetical protein
VAEIDSGDRDSVYHFSNKRSDLSDRDLSAAASEFLETPEFVAGEERNE